jgi:hypothetical protein
MSPACKYCYAESWAKRVGQPELLAFARGLEDALKADVEDDRWEVRFELQPVQFVFGEPINTFSIWIWFFASDSTSERARDSRERLLSSLRRGLRLSANPR